MACSCQQKNKQVDVIDVEPIELTDHPDYTKLPDEHCAMCAEKHFATAFALSHEAGYEKPNKSKTIDELICAIWHLAEIDRNIAIEARDIKHAIMRNEYPAEDVWLSTAAKLNAKVTELFNLPETDTDVELLYKLIGELVCCGWHLYTMDDKSIATAVRELRHKLQQRQTPSEDEWKALCMLLKNNLDNELKQE